MKKTKTIVSIIVIILLFGNKLYSQTYFQQEVNYTISVKLDDQNHCLTGFETIEYINNSPDTLDFIYFHLWANAYKNRKTALAKQKANNYNGKLYFNAKKIGGYMDSLLFKVDDKKVEVEAHKKHEDICKIILQKPLLPGESINISTPFFVKLPEDISRLGHVEQSYQMTQWFPKPAVYDQTGWHEMPYLDIGEFYSEFGSFDVSISTPKQYVIGATGNLQNPEELEWLDSLISQNKQGFEIPNPAKSEYKTIRYTESKIHDFAWFANKDYFVDKSEIKLPNTGKIVTSWSMFTSDKQHIWNEATTYINDALFYYSKWIGDYPYNNCTAVQGALSAGGGMEYPTITVISAGDNAHTLEQVIMHEVGHNWFYGILGFNERDYSFLDEGINSFYEHRYTTTKYPKSNFSTNLGIDLDKNKFKKMSKLPYNFYAEMIYDFFAHTTEDVPLNAHSTDFSISNYWAIAYLKAPVAFYYLQEYLGIDKFDEIMQSFYEEWKFKHPQPIDLENHFNNNTDKDLDWFFKDFVETRKKMDYKIKYRNKKIIVKNKGQINSPFAVSGLKNDSIVFTNWYDGSKKRIKIDAPVGDYDELILDANYATLDFNRYNNYTKTKGLFKKAKPLDFNYLYSFANFDKTNINFLPVAGWNYGNKFMLGMMFHNYQLPQRKFQYYIMPMYSFENQDLVGEANFSYKTYGRKYIDVTYKLNMKRYAKSFIYGIDDILNYNLHNSTLLKTGVDFNMHNKTNSDKYEKHLIARCYLRDEALVKETPFSDYSLFYNLQFKLTKKSFFRPFNLTLNLDYVSNDFIYWLETDYRIHYLSLNSGLDIRFFAGSNVPLNGTTSINDFKHDYSFLGRGMDFYNLYENVFSRQFIQNYGGFVLNTGYENYLFLSSVNLQTSIPKIPIVKLYSNFAFFTTNSDSNYFEDPFAYEVGVMFTLIKDRIEIYMPLYASKELRDFNNFFTDSYWQKTRFVFNLSHLENYINKF